jgi:hypothetical protein
MTDAEHHDQGHDQGESVTTPAGTDHPEHEAHGGSMAPGLVDDAGRQIAEAPPETPEQ